MANEHVLGALLYAAVPFFIAVYLLLVDSGVLKDKTGHDEFYETVKEHRIVFLILALLLIGFSVFEFFRFLGAYSEY